MKGIAKRNKYVELIIIILSVYAVVEASIIVSVPLPPGILLWLLVSDFVISSIFLFEFFYYMFKSENKLKYFFVYFLDFLSAIPFLVLLRFARVAMLFRITRTMRMFRPVRVSIARIYKNENINIFYTILISVTILMITAGFGLYLLESGHNPAVRSVFDGIWWGFITVSTIGYGDIVPVTTVGRIFGIMLGVAGVTLFSSLTALISARFFFNASDFYKLKEEILQLRKDIKNLREQLNEKPSAKR